MPKVNRHRDFLSNTKYVYRPHLYRAGFYGIYFAGHLFMGPNHYIHRQHYDLIGLVYCENGTHKIVINNKETTISKNDFALFLMNNDTVLSSYKNNTAEIFIAYFEGFDLIKRYEAAMDEPIIKLSSSKLADNLKSIVYECINSTKTDLYEDTIKSYTILTKALEEIEKKTSKLKKTAVFINNTYFDKKLNLKKISNHCGYSQYHFARLFKQEFGMGPIEYLNNVRVERAVELLNDKNLSVSEISEIVGFNDQRSLNALFKAKFNTTPKQYQLKLVSSKKSNLQKLVKLTNSGSTIS